MKKTISLILAVILCFGCLGALAGCGKTEPEDPQPVTPAEPEQIVGGWGTGTISGSDIPEDAKAALDKALEGMLGAKYTPVAYLGSQVVAGLNYSFLCTVTTVTATPVTKLVKVIVYKDLEGNASITDTIDVNVVDYVASNTDLNFSDANLAGGWTPNTESVAVLPEKAQAAFDKANEGLLGVNYKPLALLGSQVVAGTNYAVLVSASTVTAEPASALAVMVIYADLQGNATVTSIAGFPVH